MHGPACDGCSSLGGRTSQLAPAVQAAYDGLQFAAVAGTAVCTLGPPASTTTVCASPSLEPAARRTLPSWFAPDEPRPPLGFHGDPNRWTVNGDAAELRRPPVDRSSSLTPGRTQRRSRLDSAAWVDALIADLREECKRHTRPQQEFTRAGLPTSGPTETPDRKRRAKRNHRRSTEQTTKGQSEDLQKVDSILTKR